MSEPRLNEPISMEEQYRSLLINLSGIFSAKVFLGKDNEIEEIHILASADRKVKQVVRDVRSALNSRFDLDVDHRLISVAQMKEDPTDTQSEPLDMIGDPSRLRCGRITQSAEDDKYVITVTLRHQDQLFDGSASAQGSEQQRRNCIASAVLSAVHNYIGQDCLFSLMCVKRVVDAPIPICMVLVEYKPDSQSSRVLVGAVEMGPDEAFSIKRATLDAVNRKLSMLLAT